MDEEYYDDYAWWQDQSTDIYSDEDWFADQAAQAAQVDYSDYGYQELGDGMWYDPSDDSIYDATTGEWTYADDTAAGDDSGTVGFDGLEDLGGGMWYDPSDGSIYDTATGQWTLGDGTSSSDGVTSDTIWTYDDGSQYNTVTGEMTWPDGSWLNEAGDYGEPDGGIMHANGDYTDPDGVLWENLGYAGAPNVLQNTQTGDTWNLQTGQIVQATQAGGAADSGGAAQSSVTPRPPASSGAGVGGAGAASGAAIGGSSKPAATAPAQSGAGTMADLNNLIRAVGATTAAISQAKVSGAPASQLAQLQSQLAQQARQLATARAAQTGQPLAGGSLGSLLQGTTPILIAAGVAALFLLTNRRNSNEQRAA